MPSSPDMNLNWRSAMVYARAIKDFTRSEAPELRRASFEKIAASDWSDLPAAQQFQVKGGTLGFRHYPASASRRRLVLVHGSACFGDLMHEMAVRIARKNMAHVYTLDMRGHGLSSGPRGHAVNDPNEMVADIAAFLQHLRSAVGDPYIVLGGHSAGGGLVLAFARSEAQRLASAYLFLAPFLGLGSNLNRPHFGGWVRRLHISRLRALSAANLLGIKRFNDTTVVDFNVGPAGDPRYVASWSFNTLLAFGPGRWMADAAPLPREKPVLVLAGRDDECFAQPLYAEAFKLVAPHAEVAEVGPGGHWDLLVDNQAIQLINGWLSRQPGAVADEAAPVRPERAA